VSTESPVVKCPGCNVPMGVKLVSMKAGTTKVIYACVICKDEEVRQYKMAEPLPPNPSPDDENRAP
jgi:hypothetical protein